MASLLSMVSCIIAHARNGRIIERGPGRERGGRSTVAGARGKASLTASALGRSHGETVEALLRRCLSPASRSRDVSCSASACFAILQLLTGRRCRSAVSRPPCNEQGAVRLTGAGEPIGLTGEGEPVGGRLEVCNGSEWGTVCNDGFHQVDAGVVCKQLGYSRHGTGTPHSTQSYSIFLTYFVSDAVLLTHLPLDEVWKYTFMTEVACTGSESRLVDCQHSTDIRCDHSSDVGVNCSTTR